MSDDTDEMIPGSNAFPLEKMLLEQCPRFKLNKYRIRYRLAKRNIAKLDTEWKEPQKNARRRFKFTGWLFC